MTVFLELGITDMETPNEASEQSGASNDPEQLRKLERYLKLELRRHQLSERDRLVSEVLVEMSYGRGLASVKIPKLGILSELTGITVPHVHTTLKRLHDMRIVRLHSKQGMVVYVVNPDSESWKVLPRVARETILRATEMVDGLNGVQGATVMEDVINFKDNPNSQVLFPGISDLETVSGWWFPELD
jgi:hypothetical protein